MARQQPADAAIAEGVRAVLEPVVGALGLALEDVVVSPAGSRRLLRVVLDVADGTGSLSLDAVAEASHAISAALDADDDVMDGRAYVLEVTSPGVDRPLTEPRHFRRNVGRLVQLTLADGTDVTGRIAAADDVLALTVEGAKKGMTTRREIPWDDVRRGQVQVEFKSLDDQTER